jgi:hypothetical protein
MAEKGIVTVTTNYRLGVFGFLAHPELTAESPHHASGQPWRRIRRAWLRPICYFSVKHFIEELAPVARLI